METLNHLWLLTPSSRSILLNCSYLFQTNRKAHGKIEQFKAGRIRAPVIQFHASWFHNMLLYLCFCHKKLPSKCNNSSPAKRRAQDKWALNEQRQSSQERCNSAAVPQAAQQPPSPQASRELFHSFNSEWKARKSWRRKKCSRGKNPLIITPNLQHLRQ